MDIYRKMDTTVYTTGCWNVHKIIITIIINNEIIYYFQQN